ncbi:MAG: SusD family protein [Bacteroidetes bacterium ADurb.Bin174]|nr:MAG: SusD family protein [Bacteroidetes bacterium ADurb.Bin174]
MKHYKLILISMCIFALSACESYLDKAPDAGTTEAEVFNNFMSVRGYLDKCYQCVVDYSYWKSQQLGRAHIGQLSDEGANSYTSTSMANKLNKGEWLNEKSIAEVGWEDAGIGSKEGSAIPNAFFALRIVNRVIERVPRMDNLTTDQKNQLLGQAYFFRGWFYFEIIRRVGGMPLLDKVFASDDNPNMTRLNYGESSDWIIEQLDEAIKLLPDAWPSQEMGRPTKAAAYALKSMAELYAASPLMNNPIDKVENNGYNIERAKKAAQYAKECLDYIENVVPKHKMMPKESYKNIFYHFPNFVSDESLWYVNSNGQNRNSPADLPIHWQNIRTSKRPGNYGQAQVSVSQNMVDKFETINGYSATLTESGWISDDPTFDPVKPYINRDPRFDAFVIYPGEQYGTFADGSPNYNCTWEGGIDVVPAVKPVEMVRTRYMVKKWQWPESLKLDRSVNDGYALYYYNCIHIRTTQVWLDYAEAMFEAYGATAKPAGYTYSAEDAINKVRNRVGMIDVRAEIVADPVKFREKIRNERAVELLFENNRWWDIRRWMIAEDLFSKPNPIKGALVTASSATPLAPNPDNVFTYKLIDIVEEVRVFEKKHYWYPLGFDEVNRYPNLKQNPGW